MNDISVIVATYNPIWEKLKFTLDSIIRQKSVDFEIIITDDGSTDNCFKLIRNHFNEYKVERYKLIAHEENQGTVINIYDGVKVAEGTYIKPISPGDALFNDETLSEWLKDIQLSGRRWSIGDAYNYTCDEDGRVVPISFRCFPMMVDCYIKNRENECRWNNLILDDFILGAATIIERNLFEEYLSKMVGRVRYAEDNSYRIMLYDGIVPYYFPQRVVKYEFGLGISTSKSDIWNKRLDHDLAMTEEIMFSDMTSVDSFQRKIKRAYDRKNTGGRLRRVFTRAFLNKGLKYMLAKKFSPRMSLTD